MTHDLATGLKWYLAFLFSTTVHEAAHAWTAYRLGDDTAHRGGQVTLDPTPHIRRAPVGMVVVPLLSYFLGGWMIGWASAPYDPQWAARYPRRAGWMALAGPAANLLLLLAAALLIRLGLAAQVFTAPDAISFSHLVDPAAPGLYLFFAGMLGIFFSLNLLLCVFNLLPLPPLDGSALFMLFLPSAWADKVQALRRHPGLNFLGLYLSWQLIAVIFRPVHLWAVNLLYPGSHYY